MSNLKEPQLNALNTTAPATPVPKITPTTQPAYQPYTPVKLPESINVSDRIKGLINADNPILQQARTQATQQMGERGLINSSIAQGASDDSWYRAATPIAAADAEAQNKYNLDSTTMQNQALERNAILSQDYNKFGIEQQDKFALKNLDGEIAKEFEALKTKSQSLINSDIHVGNLFKGYLDFLASPAYLSLDGPNKIARADQYLTDLKENIAMYQGITTLDISRIMGYIPEKDRVAGQSSGNAAIDSMTDLSVRQAKWDAQVAPYKAKFGGTDAQFQTMMEKIFGSRPTA